MIGTEGLKTVREDAGAAAGRAAERAAKRHLDLVALATFDEAKLEEALRRGTMPPPEGLAGFEFNGYNVPQITKILGFRKFRKGFYRLPSGAVHGYNVKVVQNGGPLDSWIPVEKGGEPINFGYYDVRPVDRTSRDALYPNALLLNYDSGRNPLLDPTRLLRDYLVQVEPDNPDLLLGKAYVALGSARVFPSFFILERAGRAFFMG